MTGYRDTTLENFLLDELPSPEREEIEQRMFADDDLFARVEDLEASMIDDYVSGTMQGELRDRFARSLEGCPARREKALIASLLHQKLSSTRAEADARVLPFGQRYATVFRGALAAAILGVIIGTPLLLRTDDSSTSSTSVETTATKGIENPTAATPAQETTIDVATATESAATSEVPLMAAKRPPVPTVTPEKSPVKSAPTLGAMTFVLSTISLRSGADLPTLEKAPEVGTIVMALALESDEYPTYNVDIRNSSGTSIWHGARIPVTTIEGGPGLSFRIPATALSPGRHELVLAGVDEGHTEEVAYVDFDVR